jgi:hypothetical protein
MIALLWLLWSILASPIKSKCQLEAENVALRHQVIVLRRQVAGFRSYCRGPINVRYGSLADICAATDHIRFTPESGH